MKLFFCFLCVLFCLLAVKGQNDQYFCNMQDNCTECLLAPQCVWCKTGGYEECVALTESDVCDATVNETASCSASPFCYNIFNCNDCANEVGCNWVSVACVPQSQIDIVYDFLKTDVDNCTVDPIWPALYNYRTTAPFYLSPMKFGVIDLASSIFDTDLKIVTLEGGVGGSISSLKNKYAFSNTSLGELSFETVYIKETTNAQAIQSQSLFEDKNYLSENILNKNAYSINFENFRLIEYIDNNNDFAFNPDADTIVKETKFENFTLNNYRHYEPIGKVVQTYESYDNIFTLRVAYGAFEFDDGNYTIENGEAKFDFTLDLSSYTWQSSISNLSLSWTVNSIRYEAVNITDVQIIEWNDGAYVFSYRDMVSGYTGDLLTKATSYRIPSKRAFYTSNDKIYFSFDTPSSNAFIEWEAKQTINFAKAGELIPINEVTDDFEPLPPALILILIICCCVVATSLVVFFAHIIRSKKEVIKEAFPIFKSESEGTTTQQMEMHDL